MARLVQEGLTARAAFAAAALRSTGTARLVQEEPTTRAAFAAALRRGRSKNLG
ncbi:MAG TPA: hypothetical protein PKG80_10340 [Acidobacteriota bacterium]|nr:hypothetical protein [Acidobacteriota bacterium]